MINKGSRFFLPESVMEIADIFLQNPEATILGGGTTLLREIEGDYLSVPGAIISLRDVTELKRQYRSEKYIDYSAGITLSGILKSSEKLLPPLFIRALKETGPLPVKNTATIGGCVNNRTMISDIMPVLTIMGARIEKITFADGKKKARWYPAGHFHTLQDDNALISRVRIPLQRSRHSLFYKSSERYRLFEGLTFAGTAERDKGIITEIKLAFAVKNRHLFRLKSTEEVLSGRKIPFTEREEESIFSAISEQLKGFEELTEMEIYMMVKIILHFIDTIYS